MEEINNMNSVGGSYTIVVGKNITCNENNKLIVKFNGLDIGLPADYSIDIEETINEREHYLITSVLKGINLLEQEKKIIKKTSKEWELSVPAHYKLLILDPDGWDKTNYEYSFNEELITKNEFMMRISNSTTICDLEFFNW